MVHTLPDYTTKYKLATVFGNVDEAELAARLGSPVYFDRRGNVIFIEDFEDGLSKCISSVGGVGGEVVTSASSARTGGASCKLTGASNGTFNADVYTWLTYPVISKLGFETSFAINDDVDEVILHIQARDGAAAYYAGIKYDHTNTNLEYGTYFGSWASIDTNVDLVTSSKLYHHMKLVFDLSTGYYTRLLLNDVSYDLSSYVIASSATALSPFLEFKIRCVSRSGNNDIIYVDNMIVTQNEP